mmetsp:Transcript_88681/g.157013  ORF Transcript_88681/g.157013 Transcript_88681/m.157013 type:complete len:1165 (-) Transcript_88681:175-3669(-)
MGLVCSAENEGPPGVLFGEPVNLLRPVTHRLLERFKVQSFGVLGVSDCSRPDGLPLQGSAIDAVIVDSAKPKEIFENTPQSAKGGSQSIYSWLGINRRDVSFPKEVHSYFMEVGQNNVERMAKYHRYNKGQYVIHAIGPSLRELDQSIRDLIETYVNVFMEFARAIGPGDEEPELVRESSNAGPARGGSGKAKAAEPPKPEPPRRLRLLPISSDGGVLTKELAPQMGRVFWNAIAIALERLPVVMQQRLQSAVVEVCVYRTQHVKMFQDALSEKWENGGLRLGLDRGLLPVYDGGHDWIQQRNGPRDRFIRLAAATITMRAVWEAGFCLPDGNGVGLNHVSRMLAGTRIWNSDDECSVHKDFEAPPKVQSGTDETMSVAEVAAGLARSGKQVAAVNVCTSPYLGGSVLTGETHGSEEEWCMISTLLKSLQHAEYMQAESDTGKENKQRHNLRLPSRSVIPSDGCILSPMVEVFRDAAHGGYCFLSEAVMLCSVLTIAVETPGKSSESDAVEDDNQRVRRLMATLLRAAAESGAEVLVVPYAAAEIPGRDPVVAGIIVGQVLCDAVENGVIQEVVLTGNRWFAEAAGCVSRGDPPPKAPMPAVAIAALLDTEEGNGSPETEESPEKSDEKEKGEKKVSPRTRRRLGKTPRHSSSDFFRAHYTELREIGRGSFGRVSLVKENATQDERVCKTVSIAGMTPEMVDVLKREAELLCGLDHPGIVRLYEYAEDLELQQVILILEYIPGGGCDDLLAQAIGLTVSESLVVRIVQQTLTALAYCHARGIIHRDVKPENIMLTCRPIFRSPDCKLIDFGAAARAGEKTQEIIGTVEYMSPEVVRGNTTTPLSAKADIWAVAASAFELLTGEPPFGSCEEATSPEKEEEKTKPVQKRILEYTGFDDLEPQAGQWPWQCRNARIWETLSAEAQDFLRWLLHADPAKRPSAVDALQHPWLEKHRPEPCRFTSEMVASLVSYIKAPRVVQCCMLTVANNFGVADFDELSAAFLSADTDCDGKISRRELANALADAKCEEKKPENGQEDLMGLLDEKDIGFNEGLGFTEFIAACLYARQGSLEQLIEDAFHTLDGDRDGWVMAQDTISFFLESNAPLLSKINGTSAFCLEDWIKTIKAVMNGLSNVDISAFAQVKKPEPRPPTKLRIRKRGPRSSCC